MKAPASDFIAPLILVLLRGCGAFDFVQRALWVVPMAASGGRQTGDSEGTRPTSSALDTPPHRDA